MNYYEEQRADRAARGDQRRQDAAARLERQLAAQRQAAQLRREDATAAAALRQERAQARSARRRESIAAVSRWVSGHTMEALFGVIVVVPAVLAWTAMADYGKDVFGPIGAALPLFSEASMWVFAIALARAVRDERSTWALRLGTWLSAGTAGLLNYLHGARHDVTTGVVMAVVSVGGLVVHQLVTAGPRRRAPEMQRRAQRKVAAMRKAVTRHAIGEVAEDGSVRLVYQPGLVRLRRAGLTRQWRVVPVPEPAAQVGAEVVPDSNTATDSRLAEEIETWLAQRAREPQGTAQTPHDTAGGTPSRGLVPDVTELIARVRAAIENGDLPRRPSRRRIERFLRVRSATASHIARALKTDPDDGAGHLTPA